MSADRYAVLLYADRAARLSCSAPARQVAEVTGYLAAQAVRELLGLEVTTFWPLALGPLSKHCESIEDNEKGVRPELLEAGHA